MATRHGFLKAPGTPIGIEQVGKLGLGKGVKSIRCISSLKNLQPLPYQANLKLRRGLGYDAAPFVRIPQKFAGGHYLHARPSHVIYLPT